MFPGVQYPSTLSTDFMSRTVYDALRYLFIIITPPPTTIIILITFIIRLKSQVPYNESQ